MPPLNRKDAIEEIRKRVDVIGLIGRYVKLTRKGRDYWGICPFHKEDSPSFKVNPSLGLYHCFGCKASGTIFNFLMEMEGKTFREVFDELARETGVEVERFFGVENEKVKADQVSSAVLYEINQSALEYFKKALASPDAKPARDYLASRRFSHETITRFQLGYGGDSWDGLVKWLEQKKHSVKGAEKLGLVGVNERGGRYNRFRQRVIIPILDVRNRIIGFGARIIKDDDNVAKYINSSDSTIYNKSSVLYALNEARTEIRGRGYGILVEGYFDCLRMYQLGIEGIMAVCGTALTEKHAEIISRQTKKIKLLLDTDAAGLKAVNAAARFLLARDVEVEVVTLEAGEDPDSFALKYGKEALEKRIAEAKPIIMFAFEQAKKKFPSEGRIEDKVATVEELAPLIMSFSKRITRELYTSRLAERLGINEALVAAHLKKTGGEFSQPQSEVTKGARQGKKFSPMELHSMNLLALALADTESAVKLISDEIGALVTPQEFQDIIYSLFDKQNTQEQIYPADYLAAIDTAIAEKISLLITEIEAMPMPEKFKFWEEVLISLHKTGLEATKAELLTEAKKHPEDMGLVGQINEIVNRLKSLKEHYQAVIVQISS